jgi:hypothetical protein
MFRFDVKFFYVYGCLEKRRRRRRRRHKKEIIIIIIITACHKILTHFISIT